MKFNRIIVIVTDSVGAGDAPDAEKFGDKGADTYGHIDANVPLKVPNLRRLGLGRVAHIHAEPADVVGSYGLMQEISAGKDTTSGHWEFMGNPVENPFPTFPDAFPPDLLKAFTEKTGYGYIGNEIASARKSSNAWGRNISARACPSSIRRRTASSRSPPTTTSSPWKNCTASATLRAAKSVSALMK